MKVNLTKDFAISDGRLRFENDWYPNGLPENVFINKDTYIDSSYGFAMYHSNEDPGFVAERAVGCYDNAIFVGTRNARIILGEFTIVNGSIFYCHDRIRLGKNCMISWSAVITDGWIDKNVTIEEKRTLLTNAASDPNRMLEICHYPKPVEVEDNVWIGFGSVIMPGVKLGRGCIIGCKSVITDDVPPYAIVGGDPAKIIRYLEADDTIEYRERALCENLA